MARILVVEDQKEMSHLLRLLLGELGHQATAAGSVAEAEAALARGSFDLATLDIALPDGSGLELCRALHGRLPSLPIIMLTSEVSAEVVVEALANGARDYLKKPIDPKELQARLRGHLRAAAPAGEIEFQGLRIDPAKQRASFAGRAVELTGRQLALLGILLRHPEIVLSRESIIASLGRELEIYDRTIDSHISQLRTRLKEQGVDSFTIKAVYGIGYRIES